MSESVISWKVETFEGWKVQEAFPPDVAILRIGKPGLLDMDEFSSLCADLKMSFRTPAYCAGARNPCGQFSEILRLRSAPAQDDKLVSICHYPPDGYPAGWRISG